MAENHVGGLEDRSEDDFCSEDEEDLEEIDDSQLYFAGLVDRAEQARATWLSCFEKSVKAWIARATNDRTARHLLTAHLPRALCLSVNCPYEDVRLKMKRLLDVVETLGYSVPNVLFSGASSFVPISECVCYENNADAFVTQLSAVQNNYEEVFIQTGGRLPHIVQLLGYHPSYLSLFIKTHDFLMRGNGPLPLHVRNYLAILAASRHKCSYLVMIQESEFIKNGGDVTWLQGLQLLPARLLGLLGINKILAHQPWQLTQDHMKDVLQGLDSWSVSELVHAIVILAHFHALASFSLACGINPEIDSELGHTSLSRENVFHADNGEPSVAFHTYYSNPALGFGGTPSDSDLDSETISPLCSPTQPRVSQSLVEHYIETGSSEGAAQQKKLADTLKEKLEVMKDAEYEEPEEENNLAFVDACSSAGIEVSEHSAVSIPTPMNLIKYLDDPAFEHEDFTNSSAGTLRARDYSWDDHGFAFINSLYPDISPLIDDKFKLAFQMTYRMIGGKKNVDTRHFREAVWYYIHSIKGIRHDDYHYRKVNTILDKHFKGFIRNVGCYPEKLTRWDFAHHMTGFEYSEKVHVNILVFEARMQAELIYALRAIMMYMKRL